MRLLYHLLGVRMVVLPGDKLTLLLAGDSSWDLNHDGLGVPRERTKVQLWS